MSKSKYKQSMANDPNGAYFSLYRNRRYALWRTWDPSKPKIMFIGLNPSIADETDDDHTITRVINFATTWGYGGVYMVNLYPGISTDSDHIPVPTPLALTKNDAIIRHIGRKVDKVIFAWGSHEDVEDRAKVMEEMFPNAEALIINKNGSPRHPLYIHSSVIPIKYGKGN